MEPFIWMGIGAGGLAGMILMRLAAKHGFAWVKAELKARASAAEAEFAHKVQAAAGDLGGRLAALEAQVRAAVDGDLATAKVDIAALKAKLP